MGGGGEKEAGDFAFRFFFFVHRTGGWTEMNKNNSFVFFFIGKRNERFRVKLTFKEKLGEIKKISRLC